MTFQAAVKKLSRIAKGRYRTVEYKLSTYQSGENDSECTVYIDGMNHMEGKTWKEAFAKLAEATKEKKKKRVPKNETPGEELNPKEEA